ncbi:MAG: hypothetical protein COA57_09830 [Flavobacteriales bacterium]|nr:MAG: hypothetical protein COA57_09830 [Flavobacteriales bacterium]
MAQSKQQLIKELSQLKKEISQLRRAKKESEHKLNSSATSYYDLYENSPDMLCSIEAKTGKLMQCNNAMASSLGYSKSELIGRPVMELYHPESIDKTKKVFQQLVKNGSVKGAELQLMRKDGSKMAIRLNVSAFKDKKGQIIYSRTSFQDISKTKLAEKLLKESEGRYRTLVNTIQEGLIMVDNDGIIQYVNKPFCKMLGYTEKEIIGQNANNVKWLNKEQQAIIKEKRKLRKKGIPDTYDLEFTNKKGEKRWFLISGAPVYDAHGKIIGSFAVNTNITKIKEAEKELKQQYDQIKKYAFITSHGLRRPVSSILGLIPLFQTRMSNEPIDEKILTMLKSATEEMDKVTRETHEILVKDKLVEP